MPPKHSLINVSKTANLALSLLLAASFLSPALAASTQSVSVKTPEETAVAPQKNLNAPVLASLAKDYKAAPDDLTWGKYVIYLRDLLLTPDFAEASPAQVIAANPSLADLHVKVIDIGVKNAHLWTFPAINENHGLIFACPGKTTTIPLPLSIVLKDGRVIPSSFSAPVARPAAPAHGARGAKVLKGRGKSGKPVHAAPAAAASSPSLAAFGRYLVLIGGDRQTNGLWMKAFKLSEGPLVEAPEIFASLPAFFSQNVSGKACFSGSDIVLTVQPPTSPTAARDDADKPDMILQSNGKPLAVRPTNAAVAGYKVILKYLGGRFGLAGKLPDDAPLSVAMAFAQNICVGRADVAKAWLVDPKLVSIPKYLGLIGKTTPPMRLVAMSSGSGSRYRMITSGKNDLIIEVGRITSAGRLKGQLAIKALFVAPSDAYAAKMTGSLVMPQALDKPAADKPDADSKPPVH